MNRRVRLAAECRPMGGHPDGGLDPDGSTRIITTGDRPMKTDEKDLPGLIELFRAADAHAADAGDADHAVGDLQLIIRAAWQVLTASQRRDLFARPELAELSDLPEYEPLIAHLSRRR
jgi:hypothetical protein